MATAAATYLSSASLRQNDGVTFRRTKCAVVAASLLLSLACGVESPGDPRLLEDMGREIPLARAETFRVFERDGYRLVEIEASVVSWGGSAGGPRQTARLVLVPHDSKPPQLAGTLAGATLIRTPVERIAVNHQGEEGMLRALGIEDRLVAVGGHTSWDDEIRARVARGELQQIGYGWHMPPTLDALLASRPDVLLARIADLTHTQHLDRVEDLGIPVVPVFAGVEPHYMGTVDWVRLVGMITGREAEAEAFVAEVTAEVDRLKALAATQPQRSVLWAWYQSSGDRWSVTQRNGEAALIRDANAELVLSTADDPELDDFSRLSTEQLLRDATHADCWMIRDPLSSKFQRLDLLERFKAVQEDCLFWQPGKKSPLADTWELWEIGEIRPDWQLADIIKMLHPPLRDGEWRYLAPETKDMTDGGPGVH
ncbi:MAG: ABC transporter substrate-binding protein [Acidobacteriota bacterium]